MNLSVGNILISSPSLDDEHFEQVVICITAYNDQGATGFVINKVFNRKFNELVEFKHSPAFLIYSGGPVDNEHLFFLHRRPDLINDGDKIDDQVYFGGDFAQAVAAMNAQQLHEKDIRLLIGYCGWEAGQLEEEIEEGSWILCNAGIAVVFTHDVDQLWDTLYDEIKRN